MTISQGSKDFAAGLYEHVFGINPLTEVEKERQKAVKERQRAQEEHQRAEEERQRAEEERQRAEEQRQHTRAAILNLYQTLHLEPALIATIFEISEQEVMDILNAAE
jgi:FtsZ-interacting cell division protein YlmF